MSQNAKSIYEYDNYRLFLKDQFALLKAQDPKFSHRAFAKRAGIRTSSFLFSVMNAKANLSPESSTKVSKALGLGKDEAYFFKNLVLLNQATNIEERQFYAAQLLNSRSYRRARPLAESTYRYFTEWYYVAIKELAGFSDFKENAHWITERLNTPISAQDVHKAITELTKLGILVRDGQGRLNPMEDIIVTPDEVTSPFVATYHEQLIKLGADSIRKYPRDKREISGTTFKVSKKNLRKIKELLQRFRKEIVEILSKEETPDGLYQLNIQLFPLAPFKEDTKAKS